MKKHPPQPQPERSFEKETQANRVAERPTVYAPARGGGAAPHPVRIGAMQVAGGAAPQRIGAGTAVRARVIESLLQNRVLTDAQQAMAPDTLVKCILAGLPVMELDQLAEALNLPMDRLITLLGISRATHHRRRVEGTLTAEESDRVVRFARIVGLAVEVFESREAARGWLGTPQRGLGGATPLAYAGTEVGAREVENLLGRIEFSVYS